MLSFNSSSYVLSICKVEGFLMDHSISPFQQIHFAVSFCKIHHSLPRQGVLFEIKFCLSVLQNQNTFLCWLFCKSQRESYSLVHFYLYFFTVYYFQSIPLISVGNPKRVTWLASVLPLIKFCWIQWLLHGHQELVCASCVK